MLRIQDLSKSFGSLKVLDRLSLEVADGEILALVGPSGCGKSTLLNIVAGLTPVDSGTVDRGGGRVGYVFQEDRLLPWLTARDNIAVVSGKAEAGEADRLLTTVGLDGFGGYYPDELSGGMRQRCAIARAYHYHCDLLLMDEPFKSLDAAMRREMLEALMNVWRERKNTILLVTHEVDEALTVASRVLVLSPRPARARAEFTVGPPGSPRDLESDDLKWMRQEILGQIGVAWDGEIAAFL